MNSHNMMNNNSNTNRTTTRRRRTTRVRRTHHTILRFIISCYWCSTTSLLALRSLSFVATATDLDTTPRQHFDLATANPFPYEATQPDGTVIKLRLMEHPYSHVHNLVAIQTDEAGHPVVRDENGWFLYAHRRTVNATHVMDTHNDDDDDGDKQQRPTTPNRRNRRALLTTRLVVGSDDPPQDNPPAISDLIQFDMATAQLSNDDPIPDVGDFDSTFWSNYQYDNDNTETAMDNIQGRSDISPHIGRVKLLVVCVKFADHADRPVPPQQDIDTFFNGGFDDHVAPTGSVREFFRIQSLDQLTVQSKVLDWYVHPTITEEQAASGRHGKHSGYVGLIKKALQHAEDTGAITDWSDYDRDGDGMLDGLVVLHSGYAAELGGVDCQNNKDNGVHRIWSHRGMSLGANNVWTSRDGTYRGGP